MIKRNCLKIFCFLLCLVVIFSMFSLESFARDDNPIGNTVAEFPTALEVESGNYKMTNNKGTISAAKRPGEILYNFGTISSLEGATVQENCKDATINKALNGTITVNKGTIELISGTAVLKTNTVDGVINQNINKIEQNMGTVKENYSIIDENRGTIEKVGAAGKVLNHIEGAIGENLGSVTVMPDSKGIITVAIIENNSGTVCVEADANNKSTVKIINNTNKLVIKSGADCIVENNAGEIVIEDGGKCFLTGTDTGEVSPSGVVYPDGEYYKLILDNIPRTDIQMISNYKVVGEDIYVSKDKVFSFSIEDPKYTVMWSDDGNIHSASVEYIRLFEKDSKKYVVDSAKTVTLHIHTLGSCIPSMVSEGHHEFLCSSCNEIALYEPCSRGTATCIEPAKCAKCGQEYGSLSTEHSWGEWKSDGRNHWKECSLCEIKSDVEACSGGTATCKNRAKCATCGHEYGSLSTEHSWGEWIIKKEPEVGVEGTKCRKCSICGISESKSIPAKAEAEDPNGGEDPKGSEVPQGDEDPKGSEVPNGGERPKGGEVPKGGEKPKSGEVPKSDDNPASGENPNGGEKLKGGEKPTQDINSDVISTVDNEIVEPVENEEEIVAEVVNTEDVNASSQVEPDSKGRGAKWPIAVAGTCLVAAISSFVVVKIKKKPKTK